MSMDLPPPLPVEPVPAVYRLDVAVGHSALSGGLPSWEEIALTLGRRAGGSSLVGSVQYAKRFAAEDVYLEAGWIRPLSNGTTLGVFAGGAPNADFRAQRAARVELDGRRGRWGWSLAAGAATYPTEQTYSLTPGVALYGDGDRFRLGARLAIVQGDDGGEGGIALDAERRVSDEFVVRLRAADVPELSEGRVVRVRSWGGGIGYALSPRYGVRVDINHEDRGAYVRREALIALTGRF